MDPIRVFIDGGCSGNPGPMGSGVVVELQNGAMPIVKSFGEGFGTNNIAEYRALLRAFDIIEEEKIMLVKICSDSNLMVQQVNKKWQCRNGDLQILLKKVWEKKKELEEKGYKIEIVHIPRELNPADTPAKNGVKLN